MIHPKDLVSHELKCPECGARLVYMPPFDAFEDPKKKAADAQALADVRTLDDWADANECNTPQVQRNYTLPPERRFTVWLYDGPHYGPTREAARAKAAAWVREQKP